jgi:N-acetylmuramoyl-L-alanine amidase
MTLLLSAYPVKSGGGETVLEDVTFAAFEGSTRVTVLLSGATTYQAELIKPSAEKRLPERIALDLRATRLGGAGREPIQVRDGLLRRIRVGQFTENVVRVVLDLDSVVTYKTFALADPFRIIVDLRGMPEKGATRVIPEVADEPFPIAQRRSVIVIDPGHGGKDTGAIGWKGLQEKDVVMALGRKLALLLEKGGGLKVVLTRQDDVFIPLEDRTSLANANRADLFVSLHANASTNPRAEGAETYYLDDTTDEAALRLAARENNTPKNHVSNVQFILSDLTQTRKLEDSISLANHLQSALVGSAGSSLKGVKDLGVKKALFYVLVGAEMPCALVEVSFITNPKEGKRLVDPEYLDKIARGLEQGIRKYLSSSPRLKSL